jgi:hypothetical protein
VTIDPKSCVYTAPAWPCARNAGGGVLTPTAVSLKRASRMFARWSGECTQPSTIALGVARLNVPQAMFSPTSYPTPAPGAYPFARMRSMGVSPRGPMCSK